jgi:protein-tyrosine phosphatase
MNRLVALNGTRNLRDLGGYPTVDGRRTCWRTLYRSDCLDQLDEIGQAWLADAGLRTIIDLRDDREVAARPNVFAASQRIAYRRIPIWNEPLPADKDPNFANGYTDELDQRGQPLCAIFEALLAPGALPALIHCAAGKDRTGVAVGLLLDAVGVAREAISQDYALSAQCLGPEYVTEGREWVVNEGRAWSRWAALFEAPPERMLKTLEYVDQQFGGVEAYLARHGLGGDQYKRLRDLLVVDESAASDSAAAPGAEDGDEHIAAARRAG